MVLNFCAGRIRRSFFIQMEQEKKIHFFCPKRRIDIAIQTEKNAFFFLRKREKESNIYNNFHDSCEDSILTQSSSYQHTQIDTLFINKVRSKVAFNVSILKDDRFDALSLPDDPDDSLYSINTSTKNLTGHLNNFNSPDIFVELKENDFSISSLETSTSCKYTYNMNSYNLFNSLKTGLITDYFLASIDANISNNIKYENGCCICDITDFRFKPQIHKRIKLKIDQNNSTQFLNFALFSKSNLSALLSNNDKFKKPNRAKNDIEDDHFPNIININNLSDEDLNEIKIQAEKKIILKFHPTICTDPSPNVARIQSICDFRSKMWNQNCQDRFSNLPQKVGYSNDERPTFARIQPVRIQNSGIQAQFILPPNFDTLLNQL